MKKEKQVEIKLPEQSDELTRFEQLKRRKEVRRIF